VAAAADVKSVGGLGGGGAAAGAVVNACYCGQWLFVARQHLMFTL